MTSDATVEVAGGSPSRPAATASRADTLRCVGLVLMPLVARGLVVRRPPIVSLAERLDLDRRAIGELQRLGDRYGAGPLQLRLPGRRVAIVLATDDVHRILEGTPEPFSPATWEKRRALAHFEPANTLISEGHERADRRWFNDRVLGSDTPSHPDAEALLGPVETAVEELLPAAHTRRGLDWDAFITSWYRAVRQLVLGVEARDDHELTDLLGELRADANWSFFRRPDRRARAALLGRIATYLQRAEPGSLAGVIARTPQTTRTAPEHQVAQWLFAFDPAGIAAFRALALLAIHPEHMARARRELAEASTAGRADVPALRTAMLESLRLWPTTPGVLRATRGVTWWRGRQLPDDTTLLIHAPAFHRDPGLGQVVDRFSPELWSDPVRPAARPQAMVPFSDGPGMCPGRHVVMLLTTALLAAIVREGDVEQVSPRAPNPDRLPSVLDPTRLRFRVAPAAGA